MAWDGHGRSRLGHGMGWAWEEPSRLYRCLDLGLVIFNAECVDSLFCYDGWKGMVRSRIGGGLDALFIYHAWMRRP